MDDETTAPPLTPEAADQGQDPLAASDPPFDAVREGQVDANS
jgi:hypothetical protein